MNSRRTLTSLLGGLLLLALSVAGCDQQPLDPAGQPGEPVALNVSAQVDSDTDVQLLTVKVTSADIPQPLVANFPVVEGSASGEITVPAGEQRTFTARAFDSQGEITHEGSTTQDIRRGQTLVRIPLLPLGVGVPIHIAFSSFTITIDPEDAWIDVSETQQFTATVTDAEGVTIVNPDLTWGSSNPAFATVDGEGLVTGVYPGTARIVVSFSGVAAEAVVTVGEATEAVITRVEVTPATAEIQGVGETTQLTAEAFDADDEAVADADFTWESSDTDVATVDEDGFVTAIAVGEATISAHTGTVSGTAAIEVTVEEPVATSIIVTPETSTASRNETEQFTATVYDQFGEVMPGVEVAWSSLHPCTATVDSNGLATALSGGGAAIVASVDNLNGSGHLDVAHASGAAPASVQGDWLVCETSTGDHKLTLHLEHEEGSEFVSGSVTMANGSTSNLALSSRWVEGSNDTYWLDVSWSLFVSGGTRTFSIFDAVAQSDDLLAGDYNDAYIYHNYRVRVVRVIDDN